MTWKPHATVAAIIERDNKFLMVEENIDGNHVYNQPAGHLEPDESLIEATIREAREETAWCFQPEALVGIYLWKHTKTNQSFLRFAFCGSCSDHKPDQALDTEIITALWLSHDELKKQPSKCRSPLVLKCIEDYLSGKRHPLDTVSTVI